MTNKDVLFEVNKHLGIITLNRPQALNAIDHAMTRALQNQLASWEADIAVHAYVIQAGAGRAFCAGGDVRHLYHLGRKDPLQALDYFYDEYRLNAQIHTLSKPYIALLNGLTFGGGVGVSLHGSHRVAFEPFAFAMPENHIGFFPDIGASFLFSQLPGAIGTYLSLTGHRLNAVQAKTYQLVDYTIPQYQHATLIHALAQLDLTHDAHARVSECLAHFQQDFVLDDTGHDFSEDNVHACFQHTHQANILDALTQHDSSWARQSLYTLSKCAPSSLQVNLAQLQRARGLSLNACLEMDYTLAYHFLHQADFYEGVRARLIDKDQNPQWSLANTDVESYFVPPNAQWTLQLSRLV